MADHATRLSNRAFEILSLASYGKTNKAIALELGIAEDTVDWHWRQIRKVLGTSDRTESVCRGLNLAYKEQLAFATAELAKSRALQEALLRVEAKQAKIVSELSANAAREHKRRQDTGLLEQAIAVARAVAYDLESVNPVVYRRVSDSARLIGLDPELMRHGQTTFYDVIHPDDLRELYRLSSGSESLFLPGKRYHITYRLLTPEPRWILDIHRASFDSGGQFAGLVGLAVDVDDLVQSGVLEGRVVRLAY